MKIGTKIIFLFTFLFFTNSNALFAQNLLEGQKMWSATEKLQQEDFKIKTTKQGSDVLFAQFNLAHKAKGFDFMKKNLNQRVQNIFIGNASWIDTSKTAYIEKYLAYQQVQFDITEVHARKFRKRLLKNKKQLLKGFSIVNEISNQISQELSEARLAFAQDSKNGSDQQKIDEWKEKISRELTALEEYRYDNTRKIKNTK